MDILLNLASAAAIMTAHVLPQEKPQTPPLSEVASKHISEQQRLKLEAEKAKLKPASVATRSSRQTAPQRAVSGSCDLAYIKQKESGGNYGNQDTGGNGHYGAYQYAPRTWNNYGGYANPADAPPSVQDERAAKDLAAGKQGQWAVC